MALLRSTARSLREIVGGEIVGEDGGALPTVR